MKANSLLAHPLYTDLPVSLRRNAAPDILLLTRTSPALQKCKESFGFAALLRYT
jgi:hypothetical protein